MNEWGSNGEPFLFVIDLEQHMPLAVRLSDIDNTKLLYDVQGKTNAPVCSLEVSPLSFAKHPETFEEYNRKYEKIAYHLGRGDTYLLNLTTRTPIELGIPLHDLFYRTEAKYKLWMRDRFIFFSPETFVRIAEGRIFSHPMKGTIDADLPEAEQTLLADEKELAEHYTIVDLIRNDLSMVAERVRVEKFRYIDRLKTNQKNLLQVSSVISGELPPDHLSHLGDVVLTLLPAGSVTGAPKRRTSEIIRETEGMDRGYYTGIFGIFDGEALDSAVMIRFIEQDGDSLYFRSGGGITTFSDARNEYQEMIDKIYVPLR